MSQQSRNNPESQPSYLAAGVPSPNYDDRDYEQTGKDLDGADVPQGTDPLIRNERGREWFNFNGSWYQVGRGDSLPAEVRLAYLTEQARRDRAERKLI